MTDAKPAKQPLPAILIVDDVSTARFGMRRVFVDRYRVLEAESVPAARKLLASENPGLLLLDIEMPEENGLDYLHELKAAESSPGVIVVTAYGSERVAVEAMKGGALDYLAKPYEVDELRLKVERAFAQL